MVMPLREHLREIATRTANTTHLLVLLDYDGTLTPIVDRPEEAILARNVHEALVALTRRQATTVAIVSGRALQDVQNRVGIEGLIYAGNHGLEIRGPGMSYRCPEAMDMRSALHDLAKELTRRLGAIPGIRIENKQLTLSIHYRLVPEDAISTFRDELVGVFGDLSSCFQVTSGNRVHEIRPRVEWNKGAATNWIRQKLGIPDVLPIYLGDDHTDEDAFAVLTDGITIKVGDVGKSIAMYSAADPNEVYRFLIWLTAKEG